VDYHILVGFDTAMAKRLRDGETFSSDDTTQLQKTSIVVEMTPHYRAWLQPTWDDALIRQHVGKQVKVVGQLLADIEHNNAKDNCARADAKDTCWRASIWELHPVIEFYVCQTAAPCAVDSPNWKKLADL
jgi:hypothetical protein